MENQRNEISIHEVLVYQVLQGNQDKWFSNHDIARLLQGNVSLRTVRLHTRNFTLRGLVDLEKVFPRYRYRWSNIADRQNPTYLCQLRSAAEVLLPIAQSRSISGLNSSDWSPSGPAD